MGCEALPQLSPASTCAVPQTRVHSTTFTQRPNHLHTPLHSTDSCEWSRHRHTLFACPATGMAQLHCLGSIQTQLALETQRKPSYPAAQRCAISQPPNQSHLRAPEARCSQPNLRDLRHHPKAAQQKDALLPRLEKERGGCQTSHFAPALKKTPSLKDCFIQTCH